MILPVLPHGPLLINGDVSTLNIRRPGQGIKALDSGENLRMAIVIGLMLCKGQRIDRDH